jgi:Homing endonuclease associated repeat/HNH endonuclease
MKYKLKEFNRNLPDNELLEDLKLIATKLGVNSISSRDYNDNGGKYTAGTVGIRFGSWNKALVKAGLQLVNIREVSTEELFKNIEQVWISIGRQPIFRHMKKPASKYSTHQYIAKFGSWRNALEAFIEFINSDNALDQNNEFSEERQSEVILIEKQTFKHKTKRFPSERLKVQVLMRDGNKCRLCGVTVTGHNIHFDHIKPWSKGGETILENLQVLCEIHNLAKSNLDYLSE